MYSPGYIGSREQLPGKEFEYPAAYPYRKAMPEQNGSEGIQNRCGQQMQAMEDVFKRRETNAHVAGVRAISYSNPTAPVRAVLSDGK